MSVVSFLRDTASQFATGALKSINNIVDFFSSLSSSVIGLFNSSTPFRQVSTGSKSDGLELINFYKDIESLGENSLSSIKMFLNSQCEMDGLDKSKCNSIYGSVDSGYNSIYDSGESGYESTDNPEKHIYEEINIPEENIYESIEENNLVTVDNTYSEVFDSIDFYEEDIYTSPSGDTLYNENNYDLIPTNDELFRLFFNENGKINRTEFNTILNNGSSIFIKDK
nr:hypothetical protein [Proteus mirabilis]